MWKHHYLSDREENILECKIATNGSPREMFHHWKQKRNCVIDEKMWMDCLCAHTTESSTVCAVSGIKVMNHSFIGTDWTFDIIVVQFFMVIGRKFTWNSTAISWIVVIIVEIFAGFDIHQGDKRSDYVTCPNISWRSDPPYVYMSISKHANGMLFPVSNIIQNKLCINSFQHYCNRNQSVQKGKQYS